MFPLWNNGDVTSNSPDLDDIAVFVQVVDAGSFTAAARVLRAPKSSVSRRVARLEGRLATRLLHRTTRSLALTEAGRTYYTRVSTALAALDEAAGAALDARETPRGTVRVTAPPDVGAEVLPALVAAFIRRHPHVRVDIDFSPDPPDLVTGGHDLALAAGRRPGTSSARTKLQDMAFRLYAAPDYLARAGEPQRPQDLADHACVLFRPQHDHCRWRLHGRHGAVDVQVGGPVAANDLSFVRRAAVAGSGIALLPELVGARAVADGGLRAVLPDHHADGDPLYLVYPSNRYVPLEVRVLRDFLLEHFPR